MNPKTTLTAAAASEAPKLSLYEATTCGSLTARQKSLHVIVADFSTSALSGMSTIRLK